MNKEINQKCAAPAFFAIFLRIQVHSTLGFRIYDLNTPFQIDFLSLSAAHLITPLRLVFSLRLLCPEGISRSKSFFLSP